MSQIHRMELQSLMVINLIRPKTCSISGMLPVNALVKSNTEQSTSSSFYQVEQAYSPRKIKCIIVFNVTFS